MNAPFFVDTEVILLNCDGVWLSDGIEISHEPTRQLFAKSLQRTPEGWLLKVGRESKRIEVEDTAYFVAGIDGDPSGGYQLRLSDETHEPLAPSSLSYRPGRLVARLKRGEEAKFLRTPYFELLKHLEEDSKNYFLRVQGVRVPLASK